MVLEHAASPHVEDARDRLAAMNLPIPAPTPEQVAASTALENSRRQYRLQDRLSLLFLHKPDTVQAATWAIRRWRTRSRRWHRRCCNQIVGGLQGAYNPRRGRGGREACRESRRRQMHRRRRLRRASAPAVLLRLQFGDVPTRTPRPVALPARRRHDDVPADRRRQRGNVVGVEVAPSAWNAYQPAADPNNGVMAAGRSELRCRLPAVEKPAEAPDAVNDIPAGAAPAAQTRI